MPRVRILDMEDLRNSNDQEYQDLLLKLEGFVDFHKVLYNAVFGYNKKLNSLNQINGVMSERADTLETRDEILSTLI